MKRSGGATTATLPTTLSTTKNNFIMARPLYRIASEIRSCWKKPYFGAIPYLEALENLSDVNQEYYYDSGADMVRRFLANANSWRGEDARRIKAELKSMLDAA